MIYGSDVLRKVYTWTQINVSDVVFTPDISQICSWLS